MGYDEPGACRSIPKCPRIRNHRTVEVVACRPIESDSCPGWGRGRCRCKASNRWTILQGDSCGGRPCIGRSWRVSRINYEGPERSEEHTSELQSRQYLVCRLLLEKKKK